MHRIRVFRPAPGIYAFYEGRIEGYRFGEGPNWVDQGAISLGVASYALVSGSEAIVYDTLVSAEHGRFIRATLEDIGVRSFTVVLSHWHLDHIAGNAAFGDCEIIASERTGELLAAKKPAIESGELEGPPGIDPLILPTRVYRDRLELMVGELELELIHTDIHSDDATVVWLGERRMLLCGDTMEDPITFLDEPGAVDAHLRNLGRLRELGPERILPNHGDPEVIAAGGYPVGLIAATESYLELLRRCRREPELRERALIELLEPHLEAGSIHYFESYEAVHRHNLEAVLGAA